MKTLNIINKDGNKVSELKLNDELFDGKVNQPLLHEAVLMYQANTRIGSANTKTRADVRGGGKKPWRQKGTGRARAGSIRSPLWRGGGVVFGPKPRDYHYRMPKSSLKGALRSAINDKINENQMVLVDKIVLDSHKTKDFLEVLRKVKVKTSEEKVLVIMATMKDELKRASNNLKTVTMATGSNVNAHKVILADKLIVEKEAFAMIEERLK